MNLPSPLPIGATLTAALRKPFAHPFAFILAALPFCLGDWLTLGLRNQFPTSSWPSFVEFLNIALLWTLMVTNWHRLILVGEKPSWRWGRRELRYALIAFVVTIAVLVPPALIGFVVQGFGTMLLDRIEGISPLLAIPATFAIALLPLGLLLFAICKSVPLWLWLPSEALGRDESYDDFCIMAHGSRLRLILINGLALLANGILVYAGKLFALPVVGVTILSVIGGAFQIGALSLCYRYLSGKILTTADGTETAQP